MTQVADRRAPRSCRWMVPLAAAAAALSLASCGQAAENLTESMIEQGIEQGSEGEVYIDLSSGEMSVQSGEDSYQVLSGTPEDWPDEFPFPDGYTPGGGSRMIADGNMILSTGGMVPGPAEDLIELYSSTLTGWEEDVRHSSTIGGNADLALILTNGNRSLHIKATEMGDGTTNLGLNYTVRAEEDQ